MSSPANPTGGVTPKDEIDKFVARLAAHPQVAVLSDEIYSQMLYGGRTLQLCNIPRSRPASLCSTAGPRPR
ncbi:MAG: aminotransferase class I/II-fold pyridoxal phosphate-dependent enzyme [Paracoccaceae bacterium]